MARTDTLGHFLTDVADAIRTKTGGSSAIVASEFDTEIESIPSGGGGTQEKTIFFYDYDGTKLYEYTKDEFLALESMPANPTHTGLTAQGWNWTLSDAKTYATNDSRLIIGQMYVTDDGATRIYITLEEGRLSPCLSLSATDNVVIDWGDNSSETATPSNLANLGITHNYAQAGNYVISLSGPGLIRFPSCVGANWTSGLLVKNRYNNTNVNEHKPYLASIKKIELGSNINTNDGAPGKLGDCSCLETITIPKNFSSTFTAYCFNNCYSLKSLMISPDTTTLGDQVLYQCRLIGVVSLPKQTTAIGSNCFRENPISGIVIPNSITTIGSNAFYDCKKLKYLDLHTDGLQSVGTNVFSGCSSLKSINIHGNNLKLPNNMFSGCYSLTSIDISNNVTSIGSSAFGNCYALQSITIPDTVTTINNSAFSTCYSLQSITLSNNLTSLPASMFNNDTALTSITIPSGVTILGDSCFSNCISLQSVEIPSTVTDLGAYTFTGCRSLKSITIPNSVTYLGNSLFSGCQTLTSVTIPNTVTLIASSAFSSCYSLTSIDIPNSVTGIGSSAFSTCGSLSSITIPSGVRELGAYTFSDCRGMRYYDFSNHTEVPSLSNTNAFNNIPSDCKIIVPDDLYTDWIAANNWSNSGIVGHIIKKSDWDAL